MKIFIINSTVYDFIEYYTEIHKRTACILGLNAEQKVSKYKNQLRAKL